MAVVRFLATAIITQRRHEMKSIVRILAILTAIFAMTMAFSSCGSDDENKDNGANEPTYANYTVNVVDGVGSPVANVMVKFSGADGETKTKVTGKDGIALLKNALVGEYDVKIEQGLSTVEILKADYKLTADNKEITVVVRDVEKTMDIYGAVSEGTYAYTVSAGEYDIPCESGKTSYFVFYAFTTGVYRFSFTSPDNKMTLGYYGMPLYVQGEHVGDGVYDTKTFEIIVQDTATPYVIGLNCVTGADATLKIERVSDAPFDPSYAAWTEIKAPQNVVKCDTTGKVLESIDISDNTLTVSLGDDGCYYTNTGKKVYIRITSDVEYGKMVEGKFVPMVGSLAFLAGFVDQNVGGNVGGYIYDENGNFVCKKLYNGMIQTYMDYVDDTYGVVEMTADLAECIQLNGKSNGWWTDNSVGTIFDGVMVYPENAWLIYCMVEK